MRGLKIIALLVSLAIIGANNSAAQNKNKEAIDNMDPQNGPRGLTTEGLNRSPGAHTGIATLGRGRKEGLGTEGLRD